MGVTAKALARYGLDLATYNRMLLATGGRCPLCQKRFGKRTRVACVDHDHKTGRVRGILCSPCNYRLGELHDNADWLRRAADYLTGE
jgi:hypothetical protein